MVRPILVGNPPSALKNPGDRLTNGLSAHVGSPFASTTRGWESVDRVGAHAHTGCVRSTCVRRAGLLWRWALLACILLGVWPAGAQPPTHTAYHTVTRWSMDDGLPHNLVHAVAQGADGLIWLGTWEGVARFNGRDFTVYDRQNTPGVELGACSWWYATAPAGCCSAPRSMASITTRTATGSNWATLRRGTWRSVRCCDAPMARCGSARRRRCTASSRMGGWWTSVARPACRARASPRWRPSATALCGWVPKSGSIVCPVTAAQPRPGARHMGCAPHRCGGWPAIVRAACSLQATTACGGGAAAAACSGSARASGWMHCCWTGAGICG